MIHICSSELQIQSVVPAVKRVVSDLPVTVLEVVCDVLEQVGLRGTEVAVGYLVNGLLQFGDPLIVLVGVVAAQQNMTGTWWCNIYKHLFQTSLTRIHAQWSIDMANPNN